MLRRSSFVLSALAGLAAFAAAPSASRADIFLDIVVNGTSITGQFSPGGAFDGPGTGLSDDGSQFTFDVDVSAINAALTGLGLPVRFNSLSAVSNYPTPAGSSAMAFLTVTGNVSYTSDMGSATVEIFASANDYLFPPDLFGGTLGSTASATFTAASLVPLNSDTFQSYYDPTNTVYTGPPPPPGSAIASPSIVLATTTGNDSKSDTAAPTGVGVLQYPYSLSNVTTLVVGPGTNIGGGRVTAAQIGFSGSTTITGVIPEPGSMVLLGLGLPAVALARAWRRRTARA